MKCNFCPLEINNIGSLRNHEKYCLNNPEKSIRPPNANKGKKGLYTPPKYEPIPCSFCNKGIHSPGGMKTHENFCLSNPNKKNIVSWNKGKAGTYSIDMTNQIGNCKFCSREIKNMGSLKSHENQCKNNPNKISYNHSPLAGAKKGSTSWNKGLKSKVPAWNKGLVGIKGTPHTQEAKDKLSIAAKKRNLGGYVKGSGQGKKGLYKGFCCDSSWELAYVIYCLENNINIKRSTQKLVYEWNGKIRNYHPDFEVDGVIVEIKGYSTPKWEAKIAAHPDIKVLYEEDLKEVFKYVKNKYGKDYIKLYEKKK